jgi:hypothetical protein
MAADIARRRLRNQHLGLDGFASPAEVVGCLGAVQAQDYLGALWAVGLRMRDATQQAVERAVADRTIVRTWPMRGTLHFVRSADVRWMLAFLAPRAVAASAGRYRQLELDASTFARARRALGRALRGGNRLTRDAAYAALQEAGVSTVGQRGIHILGRLAQEGLLCFGPRHGRQQTFVLLEEWLATGSGNPSREEALARLARRYFSSHGPAADDDFAWWAGLPLTEAKAARESVLDRLCRERVGDRVLWSWEGARRPQRRALQALLLPPFDEFLVAYRDRSAAVGDRSARSVASLLSPTIVIGGRVVGTWGRSVGDGAVDIRAVPFAALRPAEVRALRSAAGRYGAFLGASPSLALPVSR